MALRARSRHRTRQRHPGYVHDMGARAGRKNTPFQRGGRAAEEGNREKVAVIGGPAEDETARGSTARPEYHAERGANGSCRALVHRVRHGGQVERR